MRTNQQPTTRFGLAFFILLIMVFPVVCAGANPPDVKVITFNDPDGVSGDLFGSSVALSGDGSTALVGAFNAIESGVDGGKAYIYARTDAMWPANPTATFIDPALHTLDKFGSYVALSEDGSTALIGGGTMTVYVYSKINGAWSTAPSAVINDPDATDVGVYGDCFGCALALSADGNTALVGAFGANENGINGVGKAYIFVRSNGVWSTVPVATLSDPGSVEYAGFGYSVALSANGDAALIGTNRMPTAVRAFVFSQNNNAWSATPVATFDVSEPGEFNYDGSSVALSASGDVALIGAQGVNNGTGVAYAYKAINGVWPISPSMTFDDPAASAGDHFGASVELSSDGIVAAIGVIPVSTYLCSRTGYGQFNLPLN